MTSSLLSRLTLWISGCCRSPEACSRLEACGRWWLITVWTPCHLETWDTLSLNLTEWNGDMAGIVRLPISISICIHALDYFCYDAPFVLMTPSHLPRSTFQCNLFLIRPDQTHIREQGYEWQNHIFRPRKRNNITKRQLQICHFRRL